MTEAADKKAAADEKEIERPRFISPKERSKVVDLDWPIEVNGVVWERVTVRRVTGGEVAAFISAVASMDDSEPRPPMPVIECPMDVYEAMDDDDRLKVEQEALPFIPRRLLEAAEWTLEKEETSSDE